MYARVLIATDGSRGAEVAIEYGRFFANRFGSAVEALYVVDTDLKSVVDSGSVETVFERSEKAGRHALSDLDERMSDVDVSSEVRRGKPYEQIVEHAFSRDADLIIVGTTGTTGTTANHLGSTAERVVTLAHVPVLTVPTAETATNQRAVSRVDDIVLPLDGSDTAERAAEHALDLAEHFGSTIHALYVVDTTVYDLEDASRSIVGLLREAGERTVETVAETAESVQVSSTWRVARGRPAAEILARADAVDADLIVMGTRGQGGLSDRLLGSTTRRVLRDSEYPVLSLS